MAAAYPGFSIVSQWYRATVVIMLGLVASKVPLMIISALILLPVMGSILISIIGYDTTINGFVERIILILLWSTTVYIYTYYIVLAFIPVEFVMTYPVISAFSEELSNFIATTCGTDTVPAIALFTILLTPMGILQYGSAAHCLMFISFLVSIPLLFFLSSSKKITKRLTKSKDWFDTPRYESISVKNVSDHLLVSYFHNWKIIISFTGVALVTPSIDFSSLLVIIYSLIYFHIAYYVLIYDMGKVQESGIFDPDLLL